METQKKINIGECEIDFTEIKTELQNIFKNPNPVSIYFNSNKIKNKFSSFINCLSEKISSNFSLDNGDSFVAYTYRQSSYEKIWSELASKYIKDSKHFDLLNYFYFSKIFNKNNQYLAKTLLKLYKKNTQEQILKTPQITKKMLYEASQYFSYFSIGEIHLDSVFLDENKIETFLAKIYLAIKYDKKEKFLTIFSFKQPKQPVFSDTLKIIQKIISSYSYGEKRKTLDRYINKSFISSTKHDIDSLVSQYEQFKQTFYIRATNIISAANQEKGIDKLALWNYLRLSILDKYYSSLKNIFYFHSSDNFASKSVWTSLKSKINFELILNSDEAKNGLNLKNKKSIKDLLGLKNLILDINSNLFSSFITPIIYNSVTEKINITKKDLKKLKYLMLYIFCKNYAEYKSLYMFFNQLEVFMNFDKTPNVLEKFKVSFGLFILAFLALIIGYIYVPIGVFIGLFLLLIIKSLEYFNTDYYYKSRLNIGVKFFAVLFLLVSSYFWLINFDKSRKDIENFTTKLETFVTIPTNKAFDKSFKYIKTSLLDIGIKNK